MRSCVAAGAFPRISEVSDNMAPFLAERSLVLMLVVSVASAVCLAGTYVSCQLAAAAAAFACRCVR